MSIMRASINRAIERPHRDDWRDDELMTLVEAVTVFWPKGPLTVSSLRTAIRQGKLRVTVVARRHLTTPGAIARMSECVSLRPH